MPKTFIAILVLVSVGACKGTSGEEQAPPRVPAEVLEDLAPGPHGDVELDSKTAENLKLLTGTVGELDFPSTVDVIARCGEGDAGACVSVGTRLAHGTWGLEKDPAGALPLYEYGCEAGEMEGCHSLAVALKYGRGVPQDEARSLQLFERACDGDHVVACSFYGDAYTYGHGVELDRARGLAIYERACLMGAFCRNLPRLRLGSLRAEPGAPFQDEGASAACAAGDPAGCWWQALEMNSEPDTDATYELTEGLLVSACEQDHAGACNSLAFHYLRRRSSPGYSARAYTALQKGCALGAGCEHVEACPRGDPGRVEILARGVREAEEACQAGQMSRCLSLAISLNTGNGVTRDRGRAAGLFDQVCQAGDPYGCWYLGGAHQRGQGVPRDEDRAAELFRIACDADHPNGCVDLAFSHVFGRGVDQDLARGVELFDKACGLGTACGHADHYRQQLESELSASGGG